jgi:hypothetical protein
VIAENGAFIFYFFGAAMWWWRNDSGVAAWIVLSILLALRWLQQLAVRTATVYFSDGTSHEKIFTDVGMFVRKVRIPLKYFVFGLDAQSIFVMLFILFGQLKLMLYFFCMFYGSVLAVTFLQVVARGIKDRV